MANGWGSTSSLVPDGYADQSPSRPAGPPPPPPLMRRPERILLSQGMTRPGIVQGQHWGLPLPPPEPPYAPVREWLDPSLRPTPRSHADPRLSNRMER